MKRYISEGYHIGMGRDEMGDGVERSVMVPVPVSEPVSEPLSDEDK